MQAGPATPPRDPVCSADGSVVLSAIHAPEASGDGSFSIFTRWRTAWPIKRRNGTELAVAAPQQPDAPSGTGLGGST